MCTIVNIKSSLLLVIQEVNTYSDKFCDSLRFICSSVITGSYN